MQKDAVKVQVSGMNALVATQAFQIYQNKKMLSAIEDLQQNSTIQAQLLSEINSTQRLALAAAEKTAMYAELDFKRNELERKVKDAERIAKNIVFELRMDVSRIEKMASNLEKFLTSNSAFNFFKTRDIDFSDFSDLQDKEYLFNAIERLGQISNDAIRQMSESELETLSNLDNFYNDIELITSLEPVLAKLDTDMDGNQIIIFINFLEQQTEILRKLSSTKAGQPTWLSNARSYLNSTSTLENDFKQLQQDKNKILELSDKAIIMQYNLVEQAPYVITKWRGFILWLLSSASIGYASNLPKDSMTPFMLLGLFLALSGTYFFIHSIIRSTIRGARKVLDTKGQGELQIRINEKKAELISSLENEFNAKHLDNPTKIKGNSDAAFATQELRKVRSIICSKLIELRDELAAMKQNAQVQLQIIGKNYPAVPIITD